MYFYAARQPILHSDLSLFGYEILFRDSLDNVFPNVDEEYATSRLIAGSQFNLGIEHLTDGKPAFINFTLDTILQNYPSVLAPNSLVVELLETIQPGKKLLKAIEDLKEQGYTIALDDYEHKPVWRHFYPYVDIIKIDLKAMSFDEISQVMSDVAEFSQIQFLAEKVETLEEFERCKELGFSYFQGYFFSRPEVVQTKSLTPSQMTLADLLSETSKPEPNLDKVLAAFERDVSLSYKLLRYSNSAAFKRRAEIATIRQALVVLGHYELKKFISLLFASSVGNEKPLELLKMALVRGHVCERLAEIEGSSDSAMAFLTGMMSLIDALLDQSMPVVMEQLPLAPDIKNALVENKGILAQFLALAVAWEKGDWQTEETLQDALKLSDNQVAQAYNESLQWAQEQLGLIAD